MNQSEKSDLQVQLEAFYSIVYPNFDRLRANPSGM